MQGCLPAAHPDVPMNVEPDLPACLAGLERDQRLDEPRNLRRRIVALDQLDALIAQWQSAPAGGASAAAALLQRAEAMCSRLEALNLRIYEKIRGDIRSGAGRDSFYEWLPLQGADRFADRAGYDELDDLVCGVFLRGEPAAGRVDLEAGMVPYQSTPARHVFDLIDRAGLGRRDVLADLGSGLGQVPLLVSACTGARCIGVEIEPAFVGYAQDTASALGLNRVSFVEGDARTADLSAASVFYLYTPFTGAMLRSVLEALRQQARERPIRVCTFGPCTQAVSGEPWLSVDGMYDPHRVVIFRSGI